VNYWWNDAPRIGSPYAVLLHAAMSLRDLPADQRKVWRAMFEHFIFSDPAESMAHLAPEHPRISPTFVVQRRDQDDAIYKARREVGIV